MTKTYEVEIQKDTETDDLFFEIPPELLKNLGWKTGDDLKWEETNEGVFVRKVKYETVELELEEELVELVEEDDAEEDELVYELAVATPTPALELPVAIVSTFALIVVFAKSISKTWFRTAIISFDSGVTITLILFDDTPSTFDTSLILSEVKTTSPFK